MQGLIPVRQIILTLEGYLATLVHETLTGWCSCYSFIVIRYKVTFNVFLQGFFPTTWRFGQCDSVTSRWRKSLANRTQVLLLLPCREYLRNHYYYGYSQRKGYMVIFSCMVVPFEATWETPYQHDIFSYESPAAARPCDIAMCQP